MFFHKILKAVSLKVKLGGRRREGKRASASKWKVLEENLSHCFLLLQKKVAQRCCQC